jgi:hypothetical protein
LFTFDALHTRLCSTVFLITFDFDLIPVFPHGIAF